MTAQQVDFSLLADFGGTILTDILQQEILDDVLIDSGKYDKINVNDDDVEIHFSQTLTPAELSQLTTVVVQAHSGVSNNPDQLIENTDVFVNAQIDVAKLADGSVSNAEFAHLAGVTSALQTQLDGRALASHTHTAADIVGATTFADSLISESSVVQHEAALTHQNLTGAGSNTHAQLDSHVASTANPHAVTKQQVALGNVENLKVNLTAIVAPVPSDDSSQGYSRGSRWIDTVGNTEYVCIDAAVGAAVWTETTAERTAHYFCAADTTGNQNINAGYTPIVWATQLRADAVYNHIPGSSEIEFLFAGDVLVMVDVTVYSTSSNSRTESTARLAQNSGLGFFALPESNCYMYHRNSSQGRTTGSITMVISVLPGHRLRLEAARSSGSATLLTLANGTRINLLTV